jgi:hypothetical protein
MFCRADWRDWFPSVVNSRSLIVARPDDPPVGCVDRVSGEHFQRMEPIAFALMVQPGSAVGRWQRLKFAIAAFINEQKLAILIGQSGKLNRLENRLNLAVVDDDKLIRTIEAITGPDQIIRQRCERDGQCFGNSLQRDRPIFGAML